MTKPQLDLSNKNLRTFGITMAIMLTLISGITVWKDHWTATYIIWSIAVVFFLLPALFVPSLLKPVFCNWMKFAFILGWINSRIILTICYYLIFTPISIFLWITGRDILEIRQKNIDSTYWHDRSQETPKPKHFEKQF